MPVGVFIRTKEYRIKHSQACKKGKTGIYVRTKEHSENIRIALKKLSPNKTAFKKGQIPWAKLHPELVPRGKDSHLWKGGKTTNHGYIIIYKSNHPFHNNSGYVRRCRLVIEKIIGRYLTAEETIHHKGVHFPLGSIENKQDDSPENLELFANHSEHMKFHHHECSTFKRKPS